MKSAPLDRAGEALGVHALPRPLSACALVPYPMRIAPSQRYRLEQWAPLLERSGIRISFLPFADEELFQLMRQPGRALAKALRLSAALLRRVVDTVTSRRHDVVIVHRAACLAGPAVFERLLAAAGSKIVYDFDDAIFQLHTTAVNRRFGWLKFPGKTAALCRLSAHVVVGNDYLRRFALRHNPRVTIVPSSIDTDLYRPAEKARESDPLVVGWVGSSTSQTHLEQFAPVLRELQARHGTELRVISDRRPHLPGVNVTWRPWSAEREVADLRAFDIGIMPMPDDEWAKGKCAMKALQYMALGVPTICSAVGTNREVIEDGRNGFLAATPADWLERFDRLIADPWLRRRLGGEGRRTVERGYSMRKSAEAFAAVIRAVAQPS